MTGICQSFITTLTPGWITQTQNNSSLSFGSPPLPAQDTSILTLSDGSRVNFGL
jgi:hypothetical protein